MAEQQKATEEKAAPEMNEKTSSLEAAGNMNLKGKVAVVTGCNTGIGKETVRILALKGAKVYMLCRNLEKANAAKADIIASLEKNDKTSADIVVIAFDLNSLQSVFAAAATYTALNEKIDYLILNAGIMALPKYTSTVEGFEAQFGVNHLAHFYFTKLILPILLKSKSRVITLSSVGHKMAPMLDNVEDNWILDLLKAKSGPSDKPYDSAGWQEYGISKMSNVLVAQEIQRRYGAQGITSVVVHPGKVATDLGRHIDGKTDWPTIMKNYPLAGKLMGEVRQVFGKNVSQGASTTIRCVALSDDEIKGGAYYVDCQEANDQLREDVQPKKIDEKDVAKQPGVKLWELSELLLTEKGLKLSLEEKK
eukprot:CAMPEP_0202700210 /NCGR_PEP_ID=MMETSP1385-20130828/13407_1 /ASSEMBLY_ACC=CAM_ASM_000861 /TAXON_ID=933848 /ORGANISM="Elphidium margaritaceum" /LENGTH=363 /DNA_ID=CAMNT_0049357345 /DNA_START=71 /DNA_END=1162 /DNA_ORIENTATION=+